MKFQLEPYNRNVPDETLLDELKRVANEMSLVSQPLQLTSSMNTPSFTAQLCRGVLAHGSEL